jgi:hypothetical protein
MKKLFLAVTMALLIAGTAAAKDHTPKSNNASYRAKQKFLFDFGNPGNVSWHMTGDYSVASFTQNGVQLKAYYDWEGNLVGTTNQIAYNDLPAVARKSIEKYYKDYSIQRIIVYNDNEENLNDLYPLVPEEGNVNYFVSLVKNNADDNVILQITPDGQTSFFENMREK